MKRDTQHHDIQYNGNGEFRYAKCFMLKVAYKHSILSVIVQSVVILNVIMLSVVAPMEERDEKS